MPHRQAPLGCRFHLVNQNLVIAGTNAGTVEVFNSSTGEHRALLQQLQCLVL